MFGNKSFESSRQKLVKENVIEPPVNVWTGILKEDEWWILFLFYREVAYLCDFII